MVIGPRQIVVELEPGPPMRGRVRTAPGFDRPFTGWISLLGALESAIGDQRADKLAANNQTGSSNAPHRR